MKIDCPWPHGSGSCPACNDTLSLDVPGLAGVRYECFACHGDGTYLSGCDGLVECDDCGRTGLVAFPQRCYSCDRRPDCKDCRGSGVVTNVRGNCAPCRGTGVLDGKPCAACKGSRWVGGDLCLFECYPCGVVSSPPLHGSCPKCGDVQLRLMTGKTFP